MTGHGGAPPDISKPSNGHSLASLTRARPPKSPRLSLFYAIKCKIALLRRGGISVENPEVVRVRWFGIRMCFSQENVFFGAKTNIRWKHQKQIGTDLYAEKARLGLKVGKSWSKSTANSCGKTRVRVRLTHVSGVIRKFGSNLTWSVFLGRIFPVSEIFQLVFGISEAHVFSNRD
jgi:hypothetical protein